MHGLRRRSGAGKRCFALFYRKDCRERALLFAEVNEAGRIFRLETSLDKRYRFRLEEEEEVRTLAQPGSLPPFPMLIDDRLEEGD